MTTQAKASQLERDVLIIGGGGAGASAAITAGRLGADVIIASKAKVGHTNNTFISGGILASPGTGDPKDSAEAHMKDILEGGQLISDAKLAAVVARQARENVAFLEGCGAAFNRKQMPWSR